MQKIVRNIQFCTNQKTEHINIQVIAQLAEDADHHGKRQIFLIIETAEKAIDVADENENQAVEAKGT